MRLLLSLALALPVVPILEPCTRAQSELDALMKRVIARRDDNWKKLLVLLSQLHVRRGPYAFVGRETLDGRHVLRIEYYPTKLFSDDPSAAGRRPGGAHRDRDRRFGDAVDRLMNKTPLVTLWVDPDSSQIVKYTFDNVGLDFLPGSWLVDVDSLRASMTMSQPFPDVWLPASLDMQAALQLAIGTFDVTYRVDYRNYRQAETSGRLIQP
jgi:hypothetical protein